MLEDEELREIYDFALNLGRLAGRILLDGVEKRCNSSEGRETSDMHIEKMNAVDIVTQTDYGGLFSSRAGGFQRCTQPSQINDMGYGSGCMRYTRMVRLATTSFDTSMS